MISQTASRNYSEIFVDESPNDAVLSVMSPRPTTLFPGGTYQTSSEIMASNAAAAEQDKMVTSEIAYEGSRPRSHFRDVRRIVVKFWFWEVAACIFSLLSLASIVGVLIYENDKPLDRWQWSVPPTATVSFIGTLSKASLVLVLSQVLSQLKWLYFMDTKSLQHIRIFDEASRGPLGAMLVLWESKKLLASTGASLMILTILVDPFLQLVFTFPSKLVSDDSQLAVFNRTNYWNGSWDEIGDGIYVPPLSIDASINMWLASTNITTAAACPSGNCTWSGPIKTLGVCGSCLDISSDVKVSCLSTINHTLAKNASSNLTIVACNYTLDDTYLAQAYKWVSNSDGKPPNIYFRTIWNSTTTEKGYRQNVTVKLPSNKTRFEFDGQPIIPSPVFAIKEGNASRSTQNLFIHQNLLWKMNIIQFSAPRNSEFVRSNRTEMPAAKCSDCELYWCEKSLDYVQIRNNAPPVYNISMQRLWFVNDTSKGVFYGLYPSDFGSLNKTAWNFRYRVDNPLNSPLNAFFNTFYSGSSMAKGNHLQMDLIGQHAAESSLVFSKDIDATIRRLADSLTELVRTGPDATVVVGQTSVMKSFIQVRWVWLCLPLALVATTCVLLLIVSVKCHLEKVAVWKDDPLALLFHSVHGTEILSGSKIGTSDLDNLADEIHVRLDRDRPFQFVVSPKIA